MKPFVDDLVHRERDRAFWNGGIVATAFVATGFAVATMALPPVATPANVARSYTELRYDRDWAAAWELTCRSSRADWDDFATYAENSEYVFDYYSMPQDIDVSIDGFHGAVRSRVPAMSVALTIAADEDWDLNGDLHVVEENGTFRVCDDGVGPSQG
jgi:hypothetical protein